MHTSYTKHKHYQLLALMFCLEILFVDFWVVIFFLRIEWGGEWAINLLLGGPSSLSL